ncbi:MAG: rRNA maturation RNase YbeY [Myxococcota bacterium]|nr:rRNA maturation RNase YbeY [Myxococcota bacterium]
MAIHRPPNVLVSCRGNRGMVDPRTVSRRAARILGAIERPLAELSIVLCDDAFIRKLNQDFRGRDMATDVLSFPMAEEVPIDPDLDVLGDVVVSVETANRQANSAHIRTIDEVTSLLIHGVLHLVGWDHDSPASEKRMFQESSRIETLVTGKPLAL